MGRVLRTDVHVPDGDDYVVLPKGAVVPEKYAKFVTNPKAYVETEAAEESVGEQPDDETAYSERSNDELVALLKQRELPHGGNKAEMVARLEQADKDDAEESVGEQPDDENQE